MGKVMKVSVDVMRSRASQLRELNGQLKNEIMDLQSGAQELGSSWDGEAKQAFLAAVNSDVQQMGKFSALIEQFCKALEEQATTYLNVERANVEMLKARKY